MSLGGLLTGRIAAGVYRWDGDLPAGEVMRTAEVAEWGFAHVDGRWVLTQRDALGALGRALDFPPHEEPSDEPQEGRDLDALWDGLGRIATPMLVLWDDWEALAEADTHGFLALIGLLGDRAADGGFALLLRGSGPDFGFPQLS
jgi:hypothetical protein